MNDAHHHGRHAWPFVSLAGGVDRAAVEADPAQATAASIALSDGVGGDESQRTIGTQEVEAAAEEVGYEIALPPHFRDAAA